MTAKTTAIFEKTAGGCYMTLDGTRLDFDQDVSVQITSGGNVVALNIEGSIYHVQLTASITVNGADFSGTAAQLRDKLAGEVFSQRGGGNVVNAKDYGLRGNADIGNASPYDDHSALQAAIDAAGDHGTVYLPSNVGEIYVSQPIVINNFNVKLISDEQGPYVPLLRGRGDYHILEVRHAGFTASRIGFKGEGDEWTSGVYAPQTKGILLSRDSGGNVDNEANIDAKIENCLFFYLGQAIEGTGRNIRVKNNDFSNCVHGVKIHRLGTRECRGHEVKDNRFHSNGHGERQISGESWCVEFTSPAAFGNTITGNVVNGKSRGFYKGGMDRNKVDDNHITQGYGDLVHVIDPQGTFNHGWSIAGNVAVGIQQAASMSDAHMDYGIYSAANLDNGRIVGNTIAYTRKDGIYLTSASGNLIADNHILTPNKYGTTDGSVYDGIHIEAGASNKVSDNFVRSTQPGGTGHRYGIYNNSTGSQFTFNFGYNHETGFFNDLQADSTRVQNDPEPNYVRSYYNGTALLSSGLQTYNINDQNQKYLAGEVLVKQNAATTGAEGSEIRLNVRHNGAVSTGAKVLQQGGLTVGTRTAAQELAQNGAVNARILFADQVRLIKGDATQTSSLTFVVDSADNKLKFKDNSSVVRQVVLDGILPSMTQAQRTAIASPTIGQHVYQTDAGTNGEGVYVYKSTGWVKAY